MKTQKKRVTNLNLAKAPSTNTKYFRDNSKWDDICIKKPTIQSLRLLKAKLEFKTYDDLINYFITKEATI